MPTLPADEDYARALLSILGGRRPAPAAKPAAATRSNQRSWRATWDGRTISRRPWTTRSAVDGCGPDSTIFA